jgi:hypothetical protein
MPASEKTPEQGRRPQAVTPSIASRFSNGVSIASVQPELSTKRAHANKTNVL